MSTIRSVLSRWFLPLLATVLVALTIVWVVGGPADRFSIRLLEATFALVLASILFVVGHEAVSTGGLSGAEAWLVAKWSIAGVALLGVLNVWFRFLEWSVGRIEMGFALTTSIGAGALGGAMVGLAVMRSRRHHAAREQALSDYEELFQKAEDGIFITDPETGTFLDVNRRGAELYEYSVKELQGMKIEAITADDPDFSEEQAFSKIQQAIEGTPQQFDWLGERKDGSQLWVEVSLKRTSIGGEERLIAIVRDISDRKQHEHQIETLHEATRKMIRAEDPERVAAIAISTCRTVLGHPLCAVWLYDETEQSLWRAAASREGNGLYDETPTFEAGGSSLIPNVFETGEAMYLESSRSAAEVQNPETRIESELIHPLGAYGVLTIGHTEVAAFSATDRSIVSLFATNIEVALGRVAQRHELHLQNARLDDFASVVSHDLRNPLTVANGRLELARDECESTHLDSIDHALDRMEALIDDLLTLAREGRKIDDVESVDLGACVDRCWQDLQTGDASLAVEEDFPLLADRSRLRQLFENLIRNAIEHGGDGVSITVGEHADGFFVEDDGPGIAPEQREAVFEAGYTTSDDGTGFGLRIVREIAIGHGWEINVTEGAEGGARFEISGIR